MNLKNIIGALHARFRTLQDWRTAEGGSLRDRTPPALMLSLKVVDIL